MKNLLEVPKLDFDFDLNIFDFRDNIDHFKNNIEGRIRTISESLPNLPNFPALPTLPTLPSVNLRVLEVNLQLPKLELYAYLLRTLQNLILIFNTISWFAPASIISIALTTQVNATISNFYCFVSQIMEIINFSSKKSWEELKTAVSDVRKRFSSLSSAAVPSNICFRKLADGRLRIYFLCSQSNLVFVDIDKKHNQSDSTETKLLQWHQVLDTSIGSNLTSINASRELQLLLERKRLPALGLSSYEFHQNSGKIIFQACNSLFMCLDTGFNTTPLFPTELRTCQYQDWSPIDPKICPQNSDLVAYIYGNDLHVTHSVSGHDCRLTFSHDGKRNCPLSAGVPSYVMQEEFNRYNGYWWQSHSSDGIYRICFEEVDESEVATFTFPSVHSYGEEYRFPRAGTPNAKSTLKMVEFRLSENLRIQDVCVKELQTPLNYLFPFMEYIVKVGWTFDSQFVWAQLLDRQQQHLELILIPVENFCCEPYTSNPSSPESASEKHMWKCILNKPSKPIQVIYTERSNHWINLHDLLHFLEITDQYVKFIWSSEETGYRHLFLITASLEISPPQQNGLRTHSAFSDESSFEDNMKARIVQKVQLTVGDWEVLGRDLWVDRARNLLFFMALAHSPLEKHLYVLSMVQPEKKKLLTALGFTHSIEFNEDCTVMVKTFSNTNQSPSTEVISVQQHCQNGTVDGLELVDLGHLVVGTFDNSEYTPIICNPVISSGETLYALVFKPHNFKPGMIYPTVLNVYGGPEVQTVSNSFKGMRQLRMHMLASQGYCVVCIDSRGSRHRGVQFESYIKRRLGTVELADQVEVLKTISKQMGFIDLNRVAIHGWSYGGYLSLMGLVQYPDLFKVAIAGAPVTSWELYDTGYTERYMDLPENNPQGYIAGSVLNYVHKFPDEANRLLLIHGLIDENVHFYHTSQLISHLIKANKPYSLQIYPGERHSLRSLESSKHYETFLLQFLQDNL